MRLTGEFQNYAITAAVLLPTVVAGVTSTLMYGPGVLIAPVIIGVVCYISRNHVGNTGYRLSALKEIEPDPIIDGIAYNVGLKETPPMFQNNSLFDSNACASYDNAIMSWDFLSYLTQEEQDFIWAHEFAHIKRADNLAARTGIYASYINAFGFMGMVCYAMAKAEYTGMGAADEMMASLPFGAAAFGVLPLTLIPPAQKSNHIKEFDCDKRAVLATGNIDAGISALRKISIYDCQNTDSRTHPSINNRIKSIGSTKNK